MNYLKHYIRLMRKGESRTIADDSSYEKHHVFPTAIYGKNDRTVKLMYREHFVAHLLLWKIYDKRYGAADRRTGAMLSAVLFMTCKSYKHNSSRNIVRISSHIYDALRRAFAARMTGDKNPAKKHETRLKISIAKTGKSRPDMAGKRYCGGSPENIAAGILKMTKSKTGVKLLNYPKNRKRKGKTGPNPNIATARQLTKNRMLMLSLDELSDWALKTARYSSRINRFGKKTRNSNFTRVLIWRGLDVDLFFEHYDKYTNTNGSGIISRAEIFEMLQFAGINRTDTQRLY